MYVLLAKGMKLKENYILGRGVNIVYTFTGESANL